MKIFRCGFYLLSLTLLAAAFGPLANAQASRTWVSGVGDDANPCSRTAPCKTFAGAISKTAGGGEIDCLDPGGFGALTITKAITIDCDSGVGSVLVSGTNGIVISANASTDVVRLRNLTINGIGSGLSGIRYLSARAVFIQEVDIWDFTSNCVDVATGSTNAQLTIENTSFSNCSAAGVNVVTSGSATARVDLHNVRIWQTANGINAQNGSRVNVRDSVISLNTIGVNQTNVGGGGSTVDISGSTLSLNGVALQSISGAFLGAFGNTFATDNLVYNTNGGTIITGNDNTSFGNSAIGSAVAVPKI